MTGGRYFFFLRLFIPLLPLKIYYEVLFVKKFVTPQHLTKYIPAVFIFKYTVFTANPYCKDQHV